MPVTSHGLNSVRRHWNTAGHRHSRANIHCAPGIQDYLLRLFPIMGGKDYIGHQPVHDHFYFDAAHHWRLQGVCYR